MQSLSVLLLHKKSLNFHWSDRYRGMNGSCIPDVVDLNKRIFPILVLKFYEYIYWVQLDKCFTNNEV